MLKHEDSPQLHPTPAAEVRVTPEELAAAITRIEARKDAGQRNLEGTVAIGEVVQQLGLDATPEELLAEVQASRTAHGRKRFSLRKLSLRQRLWLYFAVGTLVIGLDCVWARLEVANGPDTNTISVINMPYAVSLTPSPIHITADPNLLVGDASGKIVMLSEVGDNHIFHCQLGGEFLTASNYQLNDTQSAWTLIKHDGKIYVRGWGPRVSDKVLQTNGIDVINFQNPSNPVPLTLPIDGFKPAPVVSGAQDEAESFYATDIHLDKHAYEKW